MQVRFPRKAFSTTAVTFALMLFASLALCVPALADEQPASLDVLDVEVIEHAAEPRLEQAVEHQLEQAVELEGGADPVPVSVNPGESEVATDPEETEEGPSTVENGVPAGDGNEPNPTPADSETSGDTEEASPETPEPVIEEAAESNPVGASESSDVQQLEVPASVDEVIPATTGDAVVKTSIAGMTAAPTASAAPTTKPATAQKAQATSAQVPAKVASAPATAAKASAASPNVSKSTAKVATAKSNAKKTTTQATKQAVAATELAPEGSGWYRLRSALSKAYFLDVTGASGKNGTQLEIWQRSNANSQVFRLYRVGKYYRIESGTGAGVNVDIKGGKSTPGTKAQVWRVKGNRTLFSLQRNANGTYRLVNVASGLALGVQAGKASQGALVNGVRAKTNAKAQSFWLEKIPGVLDEGVYSVKTALKGNRALGSKSASTKKGASMTTRGYEGVFTQKWQLKPVAGKENTYTIESIASGLRLQAAKSKAVTQRKAAKTTAQWWRPIGVNNQYRFKNVKTGQLLDVAEAAAKNGARVITWKANKGKNQRWNVEAVPAVESGIYELRSAAKTSLALDVSDASQSNGANVLLWTRNKGANQRWYYNAEEGTLISMSSGKALDVENASAKSGANVVQWGLNGSKSQQWSIEYVGAGRFAVKSSLGSSLELTVKGSTSGKNVVNAKDKGAKTQRWKPVPCSLEMSSELKKTLKGVDLKKVRAVGIDVSHWNGTINWGAVKAAGIDFAIIRVGHGTAQSDTELVNNVRGCKAAGVKFGLYYYSTARSVAQAKKEATHALRLMKQAGVNSSSIDLPVYYDLEDPDMQKTSNRKLFANMTSTFLGAMERKGYKGGVYANLNWWTNYLTDPSFERWDRWVAQWRVPNCAYPGKYSFWQCTSDGIVPGIDGRTDIDLRY